MSSRAVCAHGTWDARPCKECEAEGAARRAKVQAGDEVCPVCERNCGKLRADFVRDLLAWIEEIEQCEEDKDNQVKHFYPQDSTKFRALLAAYLAT